MATKHRTIENYEILRRLGAGGSGVVYLASDLRLQRPVVLKVLRSGSLSAEQVRSTLLREARLASAIEHPNVCAIYHVGESDGEAFIVMQYVPGQSLDKLIARGPASLQLVLSVGLQISDGLHAAHSLGIFHRDLKPQNVVLTDGGLVKILDFGLARRIEPEEAAIDSSKPRFGNTVTAGVTTTHGGTIRYMSPEQFVTGRSSAQSDVWALGVILYELVSGRHPLVRPNDEDVDAIRAIQFDAPPDLASLVPGVPTELVGVLACCLDKNPGTRYASAAEVRDALRTIMQVLRLETGIIPIEAAATLAANDADAEKRSTGFLSVLAERFREPAAERAQQHSLVVLPFANLGAAEVAPLYGMALADAIGSRLARIPGLIVRPSSSLMQFSLVPMDPLDVGKKLMVTFVLAGSFLRSGEGFDLNWQLLEVASQSVRTGGAIRISSFDLVAVQTEIANEVFAALHGLPATGRIDLARLDSSRSASAARDASLSGPTSEKYLQARALLGSFMVHTSARADLDRSHALLKDVTSSEPEFSAGWCALGVAELQYARHAFGGQIHLMRARRAFDEALRIDPASAEANLYRVFMLLSRGEKESARHGIANLLAVAENDWNVHMLAGLALRGDGLYQDSLREFSRALKLNPDNAPILYNHRARVYHYRNQLDMAGDELEKGLALEPRHPLLRTSSGYQQMRLGNLPAAIDTLERVIHDDDSMRIAVPTLAMCYVQTGDRARASSLLKDETLAAAEADGEMAYRLATFFAVEGDSSEALHWLRRAIYLGNENFPWFQINPSWKNLATNAEFQRVLDELKRSFRRNRKTWERLLKELPSDPA